MPSTTLSYNDPRYQTQNISDMYGLVRISYEGYYGTGILLYDGRSILTAAHLFDRLGGTAAVYFETPYSTLRYSATIMVHEEYDAHNSTNDLALVILDEGAVDAAVRYELYRESDEIAQTFVFGGYGVPGTGAWGEDLGYAGDYLRLMGENRFELDAADLKVHLGEIMGWTPIPQSQLVADFDDGSVYRDALYGLYGLADRGEGEDEAMISGGDSGGGAFIGGKVAGIASYTSNLEYGFFHPDIDESINSSFGELGFWQRVSYYQEWIDRSVRSFYPDAPQSRSEVKTIVNEGDGSTTLVYFWVEYHGTHTNAVSVEYATRDGSALAGEDYIGVSGRLMLYTGETHALIPVEIIGDNTAEGDEDFYLDIFDPVGGSFEDGVAVLSAQRTIIDNDLFGIA